MQNSHSDSAYLEIFKTDAKEATKANEILMLLYTQFPGADINFDLHDCDNILRVVYHKEITAEVIEVLNKKGYNCEVLEG